MCLCWWALDPRRARPGVVVAEDLKSLSREDLGQREGVICSTTDAVHKDQTWHRAERAGRIIWQNEERVDGKLGLGIVKIVQTLKRPIYNGYRLPPNVLGIKGIIVKNGGDIFQDRQRPVPQLAIG